MSTANIFFWFFSALTALSILVYMFARNKAVNIEKTEGKLHSRPNYFAWYAVIQLSFPTLSIALIYSILHMAGLLTSSTLLFTAAFGAGILNFLLHIKNIKKDFRARMAVEKASRKLFIFATMISIFTTIGIVFSVLFEAIRFFNIIPLWDFLTGTTWNPDTAFLIGAGRDEGGAVPEFGSLPIFAGTLMITVIAMLIAIPVGLFAAIYMSEYASSRVRNILKPTLEILAGIPTVVYGFFAAITISPMVVHIAESLGLHADYTNALTPGLVMGIMIIPFISSLSDDVIRAVPQPLRDGSLALGTTQSETIRHVVLPSAFPGIIAAFLLAVSRAIGETMIVVMAAGLRPNLTANPLEGVTTVTVKIVEALTGDQEFDSAFTLAAFALGLVLLIVTLVLNIGSTIIVRKFAQRYE